MNENLLVKFRTLSCPEFVTELSRLRVERLARLSEEWQFALQPFEVVKLNACMWASCKQRGEPTRSDPRSRYFHRIATGEIDAEVLFRLGELDSGESLQRRILAMPIEAQRRLLFK